jgi:hypothetical protein
MSAAGDPFTSLEGCSAVRTHCVSLSKAGHGRPSCSVAQHEDEGRVPICAIQRFYSILRGEELPEGGRMIVGSRSTYMRTCAPSSMT